MKIKLLPVPPLLTAYVKDICLIENRQDTGIARLPFFADGNPGIMYQESSGSMFIGSSKLSPLFVYGQTVKPIEVLTQGRFRIILFYLHPHATKPLFRVSSQEMTDDCLDLSLYASSKYAALISRLGHCSDAGEQVALISGMLGQIIRQQDCSPDPAIGYAVKQILHTRGKANISQVRQELRIAERTFERRFEQHVGVLPKLFARITQFKYTLEQMNLDSYGKLSDLAFDNGYADQSHFIRSFREFTGFSPLEFQKQGAMVPVPIPEFRDDGFVLF